MVSALIVTSKAVQNDPALQPGARGARKIIVTKIRGEKEEEASDMIWSPPAQGTKCPVQQMQTAEVAFFNQFARQDRHFHKIGTEIYMVIRGKMVIEVEGVDHNLSAGDLIVLNPGTVHMVKPGETEFLTQVITINCGGYEDRSIV